MAVRLRIAAIETGNGPFFKIQASIDLDMKIELKSGDFQVAWDASARQKIAARTTARPQSPLGRLRLEIAAPRRCPATSLAVVEAGYRNKTRLRSLWTTALALLRGLFKTPSRQDQKLAPRLSVVFTATGPLVYRHNPLANR
jgi:hypothetical protein